MDFHFSAKVNDVQLYGKSRREAVSFLKEVPPPFTLVCCRRLFDDGTESFVDEPTAIIACSPEPKVKESEISKSKSLCVIEQLSQ